VCPAERVRGKMAVHTFASTWNMGKSSKGPKTNLQIHNKRSIVSLRSRRPVSSGDKFKIQIARICETDTDPYESVIPGIERLYFTRSWPPFSIAFLGSNQFCPMGLQGKNKETIKEITWRRIPAKLK
jgi:hypothetical protein